MQVIPSGLEFWISHLSKTHLLLTCTSASGCRRLRVFVTARRPTSLPGAYLEKGDLNFEDALSFYDHFDDKISSQGTLVVTEHGKLQADVEVTVAMIDGIFKGNITATEGVVLENHALVIGDIYTPELTIRGGAIIEGKVRFDVRPQTSWERPRWEAFKVGFARVWRGRIFS